MDDSDHVAKVSDVKAATESLGAELRAEMQAMRAELLERIEQDGETTRRHFAPRAASR